MHAQTHTHRHERAHIYGQLKKFFKLSSFTQYKHSVLWLTIQADTTWIALSPISFICVFILHCHDIIAVIVTLNFTVRNV